MLSQHVLSLKRSWVGLCPLAAALLVALAPTARAQDAKGADQTRTSSTRTERTEETATRAERPDTRQGRPEEGFRDPEHQESLRDARERVEVLEAQIEAKRAHIKLAEARLKEAEDKLAFFQKNAGGKDQSAEERVALLKAELPVLRAERDAELAEIKEPEILLKGAREDLERVEMHGRMQAQGPGPRPGGFGPAGYHSGFGGMPPIDHATALHHHVGWLHHMHMNRAVEVDDKLDQLRDAIEDLERDIDGLRRDSRR